MASLWEAGQGGYLCCRTKREEREDAKKHGKADQDRAFPIFCFWIIDVFPLSIIFPIIQFFRLRVFAEDWERTGYRKT